MHDTLFSTVCLPLLLPPDNAPTLPYCATEESGGGSDETMGKN